LLLCRAVARKEGSDRGDLSSSSSRRELGLGRHLAVGREQGGGHLAEGALGSVRGRAHGAARHRADRHHEARRDVRGRRRTRRVDSEGGADRHAARADVRAEVALRRRAPHRGGRMARETDVTVGGDPDGGGPEAAQGNAGLVESRHARQHRRAERRRRGRSQWSAGEDRAERSALVRLDRDPKPVVVYAPRKHRGEGRMPVLVKPLHARHRSGRLRRRHGDLVDDGRLTVPEHRLPALARARRHEFDQFRLGL